MKKHKEHNDLGLKPSDITHASSTDKSTTLHYKNGNRTTIAHNVLSPKMRQQLKALTPIAREAATEGQAQESQDQHQFGKVIMKANGGEVERRKQKIAISDLHQDNIGKDKAEYNIENQPNHKPRDADKPVNVGYNVKTGKHHLLNGYHRVAAATKAGHSHIEAEVVASAGDYHKDPKKHWDATYQHKPANFPKKYAEGGSVMDTVSNAASAAADWLGGDARAITKEHDSAKARIQDSLRHGNEAPRSGYASGGKVTEKPAFDHMKMIADLTAAGHHDAAKACYEKYCSGGDVKMYAMGSQAGPIGSEDTSDQEAPIAQEMQPVQEDHRTGFQQTIDKMKPAVQGMAKAAAEQAPSADSQPVQQPSPSEQDSLSAADNQTTGTNASEAPAQAPQPAPKPAPATAKAAGITVDPSTFEKNQAPPQQQAYYNQVKQKEINELMSENRSVRQDLESGHIQPKTYEDLMFKDKSTLGKIGSIFGMLLSSAGAGLSHQPNMFLEMMNKQIENDLQSQEKNQTNKQRVYELNQHRLTDQASIEGVNVDTAQKQYTLHLMAAQNVALHKLTTQVDAMPVGSPERNNAMQALMFMNQGIQNGQFDLINKYSAAKAASEAINGPGGNSNAGGSEDAYRAQQQRLQNAAAMGNDAAKAKLALNDAHHIPGVKGQSTKEVAKEDTDKVLNHNILSSKIRDLQSYVKNNSKLLDQANPQVKATAEQKAHEVQNFYNKTVDSLGMSSGRMDWLGEQIKTNPTSWYAQLKGNNQRLQEVLDSNKMRRSKLLNSLGFPEQGDPADKVNIIHNGKPMTIPRENLGKALKLGAKEVK